MPIYNPTSGGGSIGFLWYVALLSQAGLVAPASTVLVNTIGAISFSRVGGGNYFAQSAALFTANKTFVLIGTPNDFAGSNPDAYIAEAKYIDASNIEINTYNANGFGANDDLMSFPTSFEIRVYP